jgi:hypothetical protein
MRRHLRATFSSSFSPIFFSFLLFTISSPVAKRRVSAFGRASCDSGALLLLSSSSSLLEDRMGINEVEFLILVPLRGDFL